MTIKNGDLPASPVCYDARMMAAYSKGEAMGLSKREYFAALAMQGLLSNMEWTYEACPNGIPVSEWIANQSKIAADALLAELENSK